MDIKQLDGVNAYAQASKQLLDKGLEGREGADGDVKSAFADLVTESLDNVAKSSQHAEATSAKALVNEADMVDVVTAVSNAEVVVDTVVTVRDKVITAYQEIIKMPI